MDNPNNSKEVCYRRNNLWVARQRSAEGLAALCNLVAMDRAHVNRKWALAVASHAANLAVVLATEDLARQELALAESNSDSD